MTIDPVVSALLSLGVHQAERFLGRVALLLATVWQTP